MRRTPALLALGAVLALGAAACSSDDEPAATTTTTSPDTTTTTAPDGTTSTTTASTSSTASGPTGCRATELSGELGPSNAGAGQVYTPLVLRNTGATTCTVRGFPGVSLLDADGVQLGEPATREGPEGDTVTLAPGEAASATLHTANEGLGETCTPPSSAMLVFPPDQTEALTFDGTYTACGGFSVRTVVAGESGSG